MPLARQVETKIKKWDYIMLRRCYISNIQAYEKVLIITDDQSLNEYLQSTQMNAFYINFSQSQINLCKYSAYVTDKNVSIIITPLLLQLYNVYRFICIYLYIAKAKYLQYFYISEAKKNNLKPYLLFMCSDLIS